MIYFTTLKWLFLSFCLLLESEFLVSSETSITDNTFKKQYQSRHWTLGNEKQRPLRRRNTWDETYNYPSLLPWEFPSWIAVQGIHTEFRGLLELSRWSWESEEDKEGRVHRAECQVGESWERQENFGEVQMVPLKHPREFWLAYTCKETFWSHWENFWKHYREK